MSTRFLSSRLRPNVLLFRSIIHHDIPRTREQSKLEILPLQIRTFFTLCPGHDAKISSLKCSSFPGYCLSYSKRSKRTRKETTDETDEDSDETDVESDDDISDDDAESDDGEELIPVSSELYKDKTINNPRLDHVVGNTLIRSKRTALKMFYEGKLKLNDKVLMKKSTHVKENDIIELVHQDNEKGLLVSSVHVLKVLEEKTKSGKPKMIVRVWKKPFLKDKV